ncbi:MAG: hypothetical protein LH618_19785, partial [Saprospiraceae bacterium]|nr:hypothetical protein [Saprospiraceae bacterium]
MKQALALLLLAFLNILPLAAQSNHSATPAPAVKNPEAVAATEALTRKYTLTADQAKQMYQIQVRKQRNQAEVAALQATDPGIYQAKRESLQKGTLGSIKRLMHTKEQAQLLGKRLVNHGQVRRFDLLQRDQK